MPNELYIDVIVKCKPFWKIIIQLPFVFYKHYKECRKYTSVLKSIYGAFLLSSIMLEIK